MKITSNVVEASNDFNGDNGNYADRPILCWWGTITPENGCHLRYPCSSWSNSLTTMGVHTDNDGDGRIDEDGWDGIDNDGDCLSLNSSNQDYNGDGINCGPGDLG